MCASQTSLLSATGLNLIPSREAQEPKPQGTGPCAHRPGICHANTAGFCYFGCQHFWKQQEWQPQLHHSPREGWLLPKPGQPWGVGKGPRGQCLGPMLVCSREAPSESRLLDPHTLRAAMIVTILRPNVWLVLLRLLSADITGVGRPQKPKTT